MKYKLDHPLHGTIGTLKYQCTIEWRNGKFIADEPLRSGGGDSGPDPYSLLLASVASCTLVTLRMYIDRKEWDIDSIGVNVNLFQTKKDEHLVTIIDRDIKVIQPLTDEQRQRLTDIAKACPISKVLEGEIQLRTFTYNDTSTENQHTYTNGEVTVVWRADHCKHAGRCVTQLPGVFNLNERPWINMQGATTEEILHQVGQCPTGALSARLNQPPPAR